MIEGVEEYRALYARYIQAVRRKVEAEHMLHALNAKLVHDADVPAGKVIDYFGDGEAKDAKDCTPPPGAI